MKPRLSRFDGAMLLLLFAGCLLGFALGGHTIHQPGRTSGIALSSHLPSEQLQGGPAQQGMSVSATSPTICNPLDISCLENAAASWLAQQIANGLQPLADWIAHDPADILFHTSDQLTYNNPQVQQFSGWVETGVEGALVIYIMLAGYNIMRGVASHYENMRALPTLAVAAVAAHFAMSLAGSLIEINNAICDYFRQQTSLQLLTTELQNLFRGNLLQASWLIWVLGIIFIILGVAVVGEMILRIALIDLMLIFISAWVICFGIPQTEFIARPVARAFVVTIFMQAVQLGVLGLGSLFFGAFSQGTGTTASWVQLLVGISLFYLVLRLPQMLGASLVLREATDATLRAPREASQAVSQAIRLIVAIV